VTWCELLPEFFDVVKKHSRIVLHFARSATERCKILDKHLAILAPRHPETLFIKVDVEKCPFLCTRLNVKVPSPALLPFPPQVCLSSASGGVCCSRLKAKAERSLAA